MSKSILRKHIREILLESHKVNQFIKTIRELIVDDEELKTYFKTKKIDKWPLVPDSDSQDDGKGTLDLENNEYYSIDNNKLVLITGGDWQDPHVVEVGLKGGKLTVLRWKLADKGEYVEKKKTRMEYGDILNFLMQDSPVLKDEKSFFNHVSSQINKSLDDRVKFKESAGEVKRYGPEIDGNKIKVIYEFPGFDELADDFDKKYIPKRFREWASKKFWFGNNGKVKIGGKERKLTVNSKLLGDDKIEYIMTLK